MRLGPTFGLPQNAITDITTLETSLLMAMLTNPTNAANLIAAANNGNLAVLGAALSNFGGPDFTSTALSITSLFSSKAVAVSHGLGVQPTRANYVMKCISAEGGYSNG